MAKAEASVEELVSMIERGSYRSHLLSRSSKSHLNDT
jgi:hypothetical protein